MTPIAKRSHVDLAGFPFNRGGGGERERTTPENPTPISRTAARHRGSSLRPVARCVALVGKQGGESDSRSCRDGKHADAPERVSRAHGGGRHPVINVIWRDAQEYVRWLSTKTGEEYRLLSESEWEYVARAGTVTRYHWGDHAGGRNRANCRGCGGRWNGTQTAPVGSYEANEFGLHDVHGNVSEWVEDCWSESYGGSLPDGSARIRQGECQKRVLRGGAWYFRPGYLRSTSRQGVVAGIWNDRIGFRVARTFIP